MERRYFTPKDKISPGLYMKYWQAIAKKYNESFLMTSNHLKQYREMRFGAILAALWTKSTGNRYYVSFPESEPADIDIYCLAPKKFKDKDSWQLEKVPVQLTRCSTNDNETVVEQIRKKNKPGLTGTTLIVHISGDGQNIPTDDIYAGIQELGTIYPKEIAIVAPVASELENDQLYVQILFHPTPDNKVRQSTVRLNDQEAFFDYPPILNSSRGTGSDFTEAGEFVPIVP